MAKATSRAKLPRGYYKRQKPSNIKLVQQEMPPESTFILGGKGTIAETGRQAFWANTFAKDIINISRATHMRAAMGSWQHYREQGRLADKVAIIVDGSGSRPIKHVKLFGQIIVQEPAAYGLIFSAVRDAYEMWETAAASAFRTGSGDYINNIHIFMDNEVWVDPAYFSDPTGMEMLTEIADRSVAPPFFTLINTMPYAAKAERNNLPTGIAYGAWRHTLGKYGGEIAARFRYYTNDMINIGEFQNTGNPRKRTTVTTGATASSRTNIRDRERYTAGKPLSFPAINIGQPGAFSSQASRVILKEAERRRG